MITYSHREKDKRDEERAMHATKLEIHKLINYANRHISRMKHHLSQNVGVQKVTDTLEMHKYARLVDMTYELTLNRDVTEANKIKTDGAKYIEHFDAFEVVPEFSDDLAVVYKNKVTDEVVFSPRGSDTKFFDKDKFIKDVAKGATTGEMTEVKAALKRTANLYDWWVNALTVVGLEQTTPEYKGLLKRLQKVEAHYRLKPTLAAHSKGGRQVIWLGEQTGNGNVKAFDAADSPLVNHTSVREPARGMKSYKTPYSIVNSGESVKNYEHIESITVQPRPGYEDRFQRRHDVKNFYGESLEVTRVSPTRGRLGAGLSAGELSLGLGEAIALNELALPKDEYDNPKSQFYATTDAMKFTFPFIAPGDIMVDLMSVGNDDSKAFHTGVRGVAHAFGVPKHLDDRLFKLPWYKEDAPPHNPDDDSFLTVWLDEIHDDLGKAQRRDGKQLTYEYEKYSWAKTQIEHKKKTPEQVNKSLGSEFVKRDERGFVIYDIDKSVANARPDNPFTGKPTTNSTLYQQEIARREYTHPYKTVIIKI